MNNKKKKRKGEQEKEKEKKMVRRQCCKVRRKQVRSPVIIVRHVSVTRRNDSFRCVYDRGPLTADHRNEGLNKW